MKTPIIGLMGKARSGKDTVGSMICEIHGGVAIAFADKLKHMAMDLFGLTHEQVYGSEKEKPTDLVKWRAGLSTHYWTPRMILQHLGTEGVRHIDPNAWSRYALARAHNILRKGIDPLGLVKDAQRVIITDCRFYDELLAIKAAGGEVWRIVRQGSEARVGLKGHASETEMDAIPDSKFGLVIHNNSTLKDLRAIITSLKYRWAVESGWGC